MYAVGGGAPAIPGVTAKFALADAVFQPRIAGQQVAAQQHAASATTHDFLFTAAVAYLNLLRAFQQQAIAQETLDNAEELAKLTDEFARTGQGNQADADRMQTELAVRRNAVAQAAAQVQVASAVLVELLNLPADNGLVPEEPTIVPIELVSRDAGLNQLVTDGLSCRPEIAESRHLVAEAAGRLDRSFIYFAHGHVHKACARARATRLSCLGRVRIVKLGRLRGPVPSTGHVPHRCRRDLCLTRVDPGSDR